MEKTIVYAIQIIRYSWEERPMFVHELKKSSSKTLKTLFYQKEWALQHIAYMEPEGKYVKYNILEFELLKFDGLPELSKKD